MLKTKKELKNVQENNSHMCDYRALPRGIRAGRAWSAQAERRRKAAPPRPGRRKWRPEDAQVLGKRRAEASAAQRGDQEADRRLSARPHRGEQDRAQETGRGRLRETNRAQEGRACGVEAHCRQRVAGEGVGRRTGRNDPEPRQAHRPDDVALHGKALPSRRIRGA